MNRRSLKSEIFMMFYIQLFGTFVLLLTVLFYQTGAETISSINQVESVFGGIIRTHLSELTRGKNEVFFSSIRSQLKEYSIHSISVNLPITGTDKELKLAFSSSLKYKKCTRDKNIVLIMSADCFEHVVEYKINETFTIAILRWSSEIEPFSKILLKGNLFLILSLGGFQAFLFILFYMLRGRGLLDEFKGLNDLIDTNRKKLPEVNFKSLELNQLYENIRNYLLELERYAKELKENEILKNRNKISEQVAHDIRSPLAALDVVISKIENLPDDEQTLIKSSTRRIHEITNNLLVRDKKNNDIGVKDHYLIFPILNSIVAEKRVQYPEIKIKTFFNEDMKATFLNINDIDFSRVLSNVLNNSVEALSEDGEIVLKLSTDENNLFLEIKDNGIGISDEVLSQLMVKGATFGKKNGFGLGLSHAKEKIEEWEGQISIESEQGVGTKVSISLPISSGPAWYFSEIQLYGDNNIIILDDDESIHSIWKNKFAGLDVNIFHFYSVEEFNKWIINCKKTNSNIYLFDYELKGSQKTGLDLIKEYCLKNAYLITSHYASKEIQKNCNSMKISLLPKMLMGQLFINKVTRVVFIDDDDLMHMIWKEKAKSKNIGLLTFSSIDLFLLNSKNLKRNTIIYIDSNLGDGVKGELEAEKLYKLGFFNLYVATGYEPESIKWPTWIKKVVGKEPPF